MEAILSDAFQTIYYYIIFIIVGFAYYLSLKRHIYNLFDPLVSLIVNFTFSSTLVIWLSIYNYIEVYYALSYVICVVFFLLGFQIDIIHISEKFFSKVNSPKKSFSKQLVNSIHGSSFDEGRLFLTTAILAVIISAALFYGLENNALAIFSDNPVLDRVALSSQFRWITVILNGTYSTGFIVSIFLILYGKRKSHKKFLIVFAIIFILSVFTTGGKGSGLQLLTLLGIVQIYIGSINYKIPKILSKSIYLFIGLTVIYFIYVVSKFEYSDTSFLDAFIYRTALSGESFIHMFVYEQYEKIKNDYNLVTYVLHVFTAPFGIKLIPYNIGVALFGGTTGNYSGFGPNPQYVAEGMIFFGLYLAPLYSFAIGVITSFGRNIFLGNLGGFGLIGFTVFFGNFTSIPIDLNYGLFNLLSSISIVSITYLISLFISKLLIKTR